MASYTRRGKSWRAQVKLGGRHGTKLTKSFKMTLNRNHAQ
jgi:hypothetical protein